MLKIIAMLVAVLASFSSASASSDYASQKPLLTVRFNQPAVRFTKQLRQAVNLAKEEKTDVRFTVVVDRMPGSNLDEAREVAATFSHLIASQGVAPSFIETKVAAPSARPFNEVNVYVE